MKVKISVVFAHARVLTIAVATTIGAVAGQFLRNTRNGQFRPSVKFLYRTLRDSARSFRLAFLNESETLVSLDSATFRSLRERVAGLHSLLPNPELYSFSILIPVYRPNPDFFRKALISALDQTSPNMEVLIGYDGKQPQEVYDVADELVRSHEEYRKKLKILHCDRERTGGGISRTTNELAEKATGKYLLFMDHDDWIRPDLLYRYELTLRISSHPEGLVLYCNEYKINVRDQKIPSSPFWKPEQPVFPYLFINFICHCLLVPKSSFQKAGGLRPECDGAQDYDLCLRLDLVGSRFQNVPFFLYAWRVHPGSTAMSTSAKDYATPAGIRALHDYTVAKGLEWEEITQGYVPTTYRAKPRLRTGDRVQVIIPYRDEGPMTLKAVESILKQDVPGLTVLITCIDNGSADRSIARKLEEKGAEVLRLDEPFNYSRINNHAARQSQHRDSELILFMNNDVVLDNDALLEMARWAWQPKIGLVGCRLSYPDETLQHGGVDLSQHGPTREMGFHHIECNHRWDQLGFAKILSVVDMVTAACALIRRDLFERVGGFDEIWYPIAYSDSDLARKLRRIGYHCLYTPFATGVHHEGKSRGVGRFEEMDRSRWLFLQVENREASNEEMLAHSVFDFPNGQKR